MVLIAISSCIRVAVPVPEFITSDADHDNPFAPVDEPVASLRLESFHITHAQPGDLAMRPFT